MSDQIWDSNFDRIVAHLFAQLPKVDFGTTSKLVKSIDYINYNSLNNVTQIWFPWDLRTTDAANFKWK